MLAMASAASASVASCRVAKRCGSFVWSITPTDHPSASSQIVRQGLPSIFMTHSVPRHTTRERIRTSPAPRAARHHPRKRVIQYSRDLVRRCGGPDVPAGPLSRAMTTVDMEGPARSEERLNAGLGAAEDQRMDVVRTLVSVHRLEVRQHAHDVELVRNP